LRKDFTEYLVSSLEGAMETAYREAVEIFTNTLTEDECKKIWLGDKTSMNDVLDVVIAAEERYSTQRNSKAYKWLRVLSCKISAYGSVLDVVIQHHPEHVALAWGAIKFTLIVRNVH
jgi:hypothetical protein